MALRRIQSPGVEINEIDRSQYDRTDYSLPNSPNLLVTGFASKGEDYALQWMNAKTTLDETYGTPTNEYEQYFYNAVMEILNKGGTCIAAKLPYVNDALDKFNFVDFTFELCSTLATSSTIAPEFDHFDTIGQFHDSLSAVIAWLQSIDPTMSADVDLTTIGKMAIALSSIVEKYTPSVDTPIEVNGELCSVTIQQMFDSLSGFISSYSSYSSMFALYANDSSLTSYLDIKTKPSGVDIGTSSLAYGGMSSMSNLDDLLTSHKKVSENTMRIYDITRSQYKKYDADYAICSYVSSEVDIRENDFLGIVPVVTTPVNALFFQNMLDFTSISADKRVFSQLSTFTSLHSKNVDKSGLSAIDSQLVIPMASIADEESISSVVDSNWDNYEQNYVWTSIESLSRRASMAFPLINYDGNGHFQRDNMKKIGIVVFKAFKDTQNNNKVNFELVESFVGSLDPHARDEITHATTFIDDIVNANSQLVRVFSNVDQKKLDDATTIAMCSQPAVSMGFYKVDCRKVISYVESIQRALTRIFDNAQNIDTLPLDLVVDAGVSNIANIAKQSQNLSIDVDAHPTIAESAKPLTGANVDVSGWRSTVKKFDDFAKYTRKDCLFIADGLRAFCLDGNAKIVRKTAPFNSVTKSIVPNLKYMTNTFDSSYSAGYCNWFYQQDASTTDYLWIPPSIKIAGVCIYCDTYFQPWSAPAGLTRGILNDVIDVAFVPNEDEAGKIYNAQWNYAMSYPLDGIVVEGHKTFQTAKTALDRVNVRRLMLYLEKMTRQIARRFVYEGNTEYLRQRFVDTLRPVFEDAVRRDGVKEYAIKCDDELNTPQVIENNELRCKIAVKPVKTADFIVVDFIVTRQSASVAEEVLR